jgi:excinuclease UvrABC nuclease subunit
VRRRLAELSAARRFEDAARLRDRLQALEQVCRELDRQARLRAVARCIVAPAVEPGHAKAYFVCGGRVCAERTLPPGGGAHLEIEAGLAATRRDGELDLDELFLVGQFLRKPPPELRIVPLEKAAILRAAAQVVKHAAKPVRTRPATTLPDMADSLF